MSSDGSDIEHMAASILDDVGKNKRKNIQFGFEICQNNGRNWKSITV